MNTITFPATRHRARRSLTLLVAAGFAFAVGTAEAGKPQTCTTTIPIVSTHDGEANAVDVNAQISSTTTLLGGLLQPTVNVNVMALISDTGRLGPTSENEKLVSGIQATLAIPPTVLVNAEILHTFTKSLGNLTVSGANIAELGLGVANVLSVSADVVEATAKAKLITTGNSCPAESPEGMAIGTTELKGSSKLVDLKIKVLGIDVALPVEVGPNSTLSVAANTVVHLKHPVTGVDLGIDVILNEQIRSGNTIIVNAIHIVGTAEVTVVNLLGNSTKTGLTIDVVVSHAEASVSGMCGAPVETCGPGGGGGGCTPKDFMTGVGFIWLPVANGPPVKGNFGFVGGQKANGLSGRLNFKDHRNGDHIQGTDVVPTYDSTGPTSRRIRFTCGTSTCVLNAGDLGEPGGGLDTLNLTANGILYTAYDGTGTIGNGNVQLHQSSCPSTSGGTVKPPKGRK